MIELHTIPGPTGRLLREQLRERGVDLRYLNGSEGGVVNWGVRSPHSPERPTLNANCGRYNKLSELITLQRAGIRVVPFQDLSNSVSLDFPVLGRKLSHTQGKDIVPILANDSVFEGIVRARSVDFFTQYVPKRTEYRVWSFRKRIKAIYEKHLVRPHELRRIGSNHSNGFAFEIVSGADERLKELGANAVDALGLDFGAVDILQGVDNQYYVLEVNTAPGVEGPRQGLTGFADSIARWERNGYRRRNGAEETA